MSKHRASDRDGSERSSKRARRDNKPSRVLYIGNLPPNVNEDDILGMCRQASPMARPVRILMLRNQAFVQMAQIQDAIQIKQMMNVNPKFIDGKRIYVEFSDRDQISEDRQGGSRQVVQLNSARGGGGGGGGFGGRGGGGGGGGGGFGGGGGGGGGFQPPQPNPNLFNQAQQMPPPQQQFGGVVPGASSAPVAMPQAVAMSSPNVYDGGLSAAAGQPQYAPADVVSAPPLIVQPSKVLHVRGLAPNVTDEILVSMILPLTVGSVLRTLIFASRAQGFVEFDSEDTAIEVMATCNTHPPVLQGSPLIFSYSRRANITPDLVNQTAAAIAAAQQQAPQQPPVQQMQQQAPGMDSFRGGGDPGFGGRQAPGGNVGGGLLPPPRQDGPFGQQMPMPGGGGGMSSSSRRMSGMPQPGGGGMPPMRGGDDNRGPPPQSQDGDFDHCIVFVRNMAEDRMTPDKIRALFSDYGDVLKVKIVFNKKSQAMVMMGDAEQARRVIENLSGVDVYGKTLRLNISSNTSLNVSKPNNASGYDDHQRYNRDYSADHRQLRFFDRSKNTRNRVFPPSSMLHIANMLSGTSKDDMLALFAKHNPVASQMGDRGQTAWVQFKDPGEAIEALMDADFRQMSGRTVRVSFSGKRSLRG